MMQRHAAIVGDISSKIRQFYDAKLPFRISHGSTNSTRYAKDGQNIIDTSSLCNVLSIDRKQRTALVEPNVAMDSLIAATIPHGLIPPVVMEFPGITAGGGFAGTAGESSSFKHGYFDRTVNQIEMILGNGEIVTASRNERRDLFDGAAGALGTLGVTTLLQLQLVEAKPFVQATYRPVNSIEEALRLVQNLVARADAEDIDYIDGIMFSKFRGAIISGKLIDNIPADTQLRHFNRARDPWFYLHVQDSIGFNAGMNEPVTEVMPLQEYLLRYDRGGFWVGRAAFKYWHFPFNRLTRWFLDDFLHTRMLYRALHASKSAIGFVVQDLALPYNTAAKFVEYTDKQFGIYPLWLCPLKQQVTPTFHPHLLETEADGKTLKAMINIGLWGNGPNNYEEFIAKNKHLEQKLREFGGMKWFYAQTYYSREEFWEIYNATWYDHLRQKYHATTLPSVWDKAHVDVERERAERRQSWLVGLLQIWPMAGIWGIWRAIISGDWRIPHRVKSSQNKDGSTGLT